MTVASRDFLRLVQGLGPWLMGGLVLVALIVVAAVAVLVLRGRGAPDRLRSIAETLTWTFFALSLEAAVMGAVVAPKFKTAAEVAQLEWLPAWSAVTFLGWSVQLQPVSASVAFALFCLSLGLAVASWTETGDSGRRWLAGLSGAGSLVLAVVLAWGLYSMLGGHAEMLRLAAQKG